MALTKAPEELLDKSLTSELTITTSDNTTQLTLKSTDADGSLGPRLDLTRDSSSPAASDVLGVIRWMGEDDAGNSLGYANISTTIADPTDTSESGSFEIDVRQAGTNRSRMLMNQTTTVFNQDGVDVDFRVESDSSANMLVVDAGNNKVLVEAQNTASVTDAASMIAASAFEINGDAGEGSDILRFFAMADGTGDYGMEVSNSSGASTYKLKINPINGGNLYSGGNLEFPSGKGIDFANSGGSSATNASTGSHLLDDYEEGTWTPTINNGTVSVSQATYTKIGNLVTVRANLADISDHTTASDIIIGGIPFGAGSTNRGVGSVLFRRFSKGNASHMVSYIGQNGSNIYFYWSFNADSLWTAVHFEDGTQANMDIIFNLSYIV